MTQREIIRNGATITYVEEDEVERPLLTHMFYDPGIFIKFFWKPTLLSKRFQTTEYHSLAKEVANNETLDPQHPVGAVFEKDNQIIGKGANGSNYHSGHGCYRKDHGIPTGEQYELCEGCHPKHHAEAKAINDVIGCFGEEKGRELLLGSTVHLYGHWYCCRPCVELMEAYGVTNAVIEKEWVRQHLAI